MQQLVNTNVNVTGPMNFSAALPRPPLPARQRDSYDSTVKFGEFYRDLAVLAFPKTTNNVIARESVLDLSAKLDADGKLNWEIPPGDWVIQRIGHTTTGSSTRPPVAGGNGLECDKLSAAAMDAHFAGMMAKLLVTAGTNAGKSLAATHIDSWEVGGQNWTPQLRAEFQKRRGYDPILFLPSLLDSSREKVGGKTATRYAHEIGGKALADRFRWDFSQTLSELLAENYVGRLATLAHEHGLRLSMEGYDLPFGDEANYTAQADEPMSEFWVNMPAWTNGKSERKGRQMASVAHTTGKNIVGAEAFTSDEHERWMQHPATIKALGDFEFCQGINRFVIHRYAHQPFTNRAPGATMGPWGLHYERTQTWWEMSGAWHEYLARCQFMLRQGLFVADLLYLRAENPNQTYFTPNPSPPAGYRYDEISAQTLLARVTVKDGHLTLPDGMNYRVLVLPPMKTMTPALAEKLKSLVRDGATVVTTSARPKTSPSLAGFPKCDEQVAALTQEIWGALDGKQNTTNTVGKGKLVWGESLAKVLVDLEAMLDFTSDVPLNWIHRRTANEDLYFVSNPSTNPIATLCTFRAVGYPEIWNPETGEMQTAITMNPCDKCDRTNNTLGLSLAPADSVFVLFRKAGRPLPASTPATNVLAEVNEPWTVSFDPKRGDPEPVKFEQLNSWSDSTNAGVKFYSGTAVYRTTFMLQNSKPETRNQKLILQLGDVQVMARVMVNGQACGVAWRPPFRVDVTGAIRDGQNVLEIAVANLWPNRMIGDAALPESERVTWSSWQPFATNTPLLKSGLLGPVKLVSQTR
jgi:hypothetical protein